jgi:hypothetical protein
MTMDNSEFWQALEADVLNQEASEAGPLAEDLAATGPALQVHKHVIYNVESGDVTLIPGTPISCGPDRSGNGCIWYLTDGKPARVLTIFTGQEFARAVIRPLGTLMNVGGYVWHFLVVE